MHVINISKALLLNVLFNEQNKFPIIVLSNNYVGHQDAVPSTVLSENVLALLHCLAYIPVLPVARCPSIVINIGTTIY